MNHDMPPTYITLHDLSGRTVTVGVNAVRNMMQRGDDLHCRETWDEIITLLIAAQ